MFWLATAFGIFAVGREGLMIWRDVIPEYTFFFNYIKAWDVMVHCFSRFSFTLVMS